MIRIVSLALQTVSCDYAHLSLCCIQAKAEYTRKMDVFMKKRNFLLPFGLLAAFVVWTALVCLVDVQPIGPGGSAVGFGFLNGWMHNTTGVNWQMYVLTDWLGLVPVAVGFGFGILGLFQWIKRKSILAVDIDLLILGGFYLVTVAAYLLFEQVVINYRPVLIEGVLEASYPSSTTLLVLCVMPAAMAQFQSRIENKILRNIVLTSVGAFIAFMVLGRILSGVHWLSDIVGGTLLSSGLVTLYCVLVRKFRKN